MHAVVHSGNYSFVDLVAINKVHKGTVLYGTVLYDTVLYGTVLYGTAERFWVSKLHHKTGIRLQPGII